MIARVVVAVVLVGAFVVPATALESAGGERVFRFQDPRIIESSGLVDLGPVMVTTNDSGDTARVFVVDPATGETVGMTEFDAEVLDVEALAPAGPGAVWVGDIGDNARSRDSVSVHRVPVGRRQIDIGSPESYRLTYPDGPHDAESLLVDPRGRLLVITKSLTGGQVFRTAAPLRRTGANTLRLVGEVEDFATDAASLPGGQVVVRSLGQASVYRADFTRLATFPLPRQQQGEGLSVGPGGRLRISTEGGGSVVQQVTLPEEAREAMRRPESSPRSPAVGPELDSPDTIDSSSNTRLSWLVGGTLVLGAIGAGIAVRRRSA